MKGRHGIILAAILLASITITPAQAVYVKTTETRLTLTSAHQSDAATYNDVTVYVDTGSGDGDIFSVMVPGASEPVYVGPGTQQRPDVDGDLVVLENNVDGDFEIYLYDYVLYETQRLTYNPAIENQAEISGDNIVYGSTRGGGGGDIYWYSIPNMEELPLTMTPEPEEAPDIDGDLVAWQVTEGGQYNIYGVELTDLGNPFSVAISPAHEYDPSVSGSRIAYLRSSDVVLYDHSIPQTTIITNDGWIQENVVISGDYLYWQDDSDGDIEVFVHDLTNGQTHQLTDDAWDQELTDATGNRVVYHDFREGDANVYSLVWEYNTPPIANAGEDQEVVVGQTVDLFGSGWDPDFDPLIGAMWTIESKPVGSTAELSDPYDWDPTFVPDLPGEYLLSFIVTDGMDPSEPDYMTVTASCPVPAGNMNEDPAVDLEDWALFEACLAGPDVPYPTGCFCADVTGDGDVDLADSATFQRALTGSP